MGKYKKKSFVLGSYWIGGKPGRPGWFRCWLEGRQVRRVSLGTVDFEEAKERLISWFLPQQHGSANGDLMSLTEVLLAYYEAHGKTVASAADVKISARLWADYFGPIAASDACDVDRLEGFKSWLAEKGYNPGYVNRVLSVGRAALMRAYERRLISIRPVVKGVPGHRGKPKGEPLSVDELTRLYRELHEPHLIRFVVLGLGTGARPDAIKSLHWPQVDLVGRCIHFNPPGRAQTKKRRGDVPICEYLADQLAEWGGEDGWRGPVVHFRGKAVSEVKTSWRKARERAWLGAACNPYSLRHSVAKWLRSQGVPPWEVAALLGHKLPGYTITEMYASADPKPHDSNQGRPR